MSFDLTQKVSSVVRFLLENTALRSSFSYASSDEFNYGNQNPLTNFQKHLLETPYSTVRAKIVQQLDRQDDTLNSNRIVRNMREKLYREHYDFMKQQRLECLHRGAWFHSSSGSGSISGTAAPGKRTSHYNWKLRSSNGAASWFRFYRVGVNNKSLHYGDFKDVANFDALPAITDLPERGKTKLNDEEIDRSILIDPTPTLTLVDISSLVDVFEHAAPSSHAAEYSTPRPTHFLTSAANLFSKQSSTTELSLTFSLVSSSSLSTTTSDTTASSRSSSTTLLSPTSASANTAFNNSHSAAVLAEFSCLNQVQFSEWTDGFRILANKPIGHSITRSLVDDLTDISLKLSLLDFTGNEIDLANATRILESLDQELPSLPNCDFVYSAASDSFLFSRIDADKSRANDVGADFGKGVRRNVLRVKRKPIKSVLPSTILLNGTQLEEDELYSPHLSEDDEIDGEEEEEEEDQQEDEEEEEE